ncbi:hypothetical protein HPB47_028259 [Ixodes persulcatus]|uniref:Uncharacterized protein n=1 Tax=Ixodes persulcatus TaxID=34615 RepID=A0AC60PTS0_IXOPE|nr:hypothetical protein HPB47_028259 [Ixodes persulcatus]
MVNCAAFGCNNRSRNKKNDTGSFKGGFYRIPPIVTSEGPEAERLLRERRREWRRRLKRDDFDDAATHYRVCGIHFVSGRVTDRYYPGTQADDCSWEIADRLNREVNQLRVEIYSLRESLNARCLTYATFLRDDELTKFYTGLPNFKLLNGVFTLVKELVRHIPINALPQFQEFVVTLIRLRLNVPLRDLAFRFDVSEATKDLMKWIDGLKCAIEPGRRGRRDKARHDSHSLSSSLRPVKLVNRSEEERSEAASPHSQILTEDSYVKELA